MKFLCQRDVSMYRTNYLGKFFEVIKEENAVLVGKETNLPLVSALDDAHSRSSGLKVGLAWH